MSLLQEKSKLSLLQTYSKEVQLNQTKRLINPN